LGFTGRPNPEVGSADGRSRSLARPELFPDGRHVRPSSVGSFKGSRWSGFSGSSTRCVKTWTSSFALQRTVWHRPGSSSRQGR